tara:strand:+ start:906 stop:1691 length:786 start_codon:yes stop_codon:yes gene_type:complete
MNFFFGINNNVFQSQLTIPKFQNKKNEIITTDVFKSFPKENKWIVQKMYEKELNDQFYRIKGNNIKNNEIYFLANESNFNNKENLILKKFNNFTDTVPEYRSNLKIYFTDKGKGEGYSSYQSEYPYRMIKIKNSIVSQVYSLTNKKAKKNYILFRNIYEHPSHEEFFGYLIDVKTKKIIKKFTLLTNYTNFIEIENQLVNADVYFVTDKFLGIPVFISEHFGHLSMEHTHPPHTYIISQSKFERVNILKKKINEIINKETF